MKNVTLLKRFLKIQFNQLPCNALTFLSSAFLKTFFKQYATVTKILFRISCKVTEILQFIHFTRCTLNHIRYGVV